VEIIGEKKKKKIKNKIKPAKCMHGLCIGPSKKGMIREPNLVIFFILKGG
jgi:hypothetical protein